ncbi:hypothetical protein BX666DRAFT_1865485 [Dichotomocladium elegans]|nr:hypothetical protein BX666DRAFT_1865485 [Dichotomocladium elegans]
MPELRIRVGQSLDTLKPIEINASTPTLLRSDAFQGLVGVHIRNHVPPSAALGPDAPDSFCISVQGRFLQPEDLCADDIVFGNKFERPLKLPIGSSLAIAFAEWFDPGLETNLYCNQPQAFSPLIVTMNRLAIHLADNRCNDETGTATTMDAYFKDDVSAIVQGLDKPDMRRKYFSDPAHRKAVKVTPDQIWTMAFMNPYIDFNNFVLHLPMMDINVLKYWDGQPLRYYAKTRDDNTVFFIVEFDVV